MPNNGEANAVNKIFLEHEKQVDRALDVKNSDNYTTLLNGPIKSAQDTLNAYKDTKGIDKVLVKVLQDKIYLFKSAK